MTDLMSDEGQRALCAFAARVPLCLFDFDGTLAPLAPDPTGVLLPAPVRAQLQALQLHAPVGIVTGRSLADMRERLGFAPDYLIGNHGLEGVPGERRQHAALVQVCAGWKDWLAPRVAGIDPAIWLEDKHYSLSLHYLQARDHPQAMAGLSELFAQLQPAPRIIPGKCIFSLLPAGRGDKGEAVQQLLRFTQRDAALYVGDDVTDEDVFRLHDPGIFSVRVGRSDASAARWYIDGHHAIGVLLDTLLRCMPARAMAP
jgi:trehalose 6-phosphate phosphatase